MSKFKETVKDLAILTLSGFLIGAVLALIAGTILNLVGIFK